MAKSNKRRDQERRAAAAARIAEMQAAQRAAERRRRSVLISAVVAAVVVVIIGVFIIVAISNNPPTVAGRVVGGSTGKYGFVVGNADAPVRLIAYEDFMCPTCGNFEKSSGATISKYISQGKIQVEYRPVAFLDSKSTTDYSTRALNAAACVRNFSTATAFKTFHDLLFAHQPAEGSAGLSNSQLTTYANQAIGKPNGSVTGCINGETYKNWTSSATNQWSKDGFTATPTVILDGTTLNYDSQVKDPTTFKAVLDKEIAAKTPPTTTPPTTTGPTTTESTTGPTTTGTTTTGATTTGTTTTGPTKTKQTSSKK